MTTATMSDRLRQIAILISSVDSSAARQILLQLPTDTARQIRHLSTRLGEVSAEEKRRVLIDFQRSAASSIGTSTETSLDRPASRTATQTIGDDSTSAAVSDLHLLGRPLAVNPGEPSSPVATDPSTSGGSGAPAAWTRLSTAALVRFVCQERAAVTAVVVSQLAPGAAVEVLQHLPVETRRDVLQRLAGLQEIDPEAMQTIDDHLSQRLHEYQYQIQSELENARRIQALLAAAPPELRSDWSQLLGGTAAEPAPERTESRTATEQSTGDQPPRSPAAPSDRDDLVERKLPHAVGDDGDILPFRRDAENRASRTDNAAERLLIQWEFEQILLLPATALAHLLSSTDSQTVLLALAGASPEFMKQFYRMLNRHDARMLEARLQRIGPIQLRDVDMAQQKIVDNAAELRGVLHSGQSRQAA